MSTQQKVGGIRIIPNTDGSQTNSLDLANKANSHAVKLASPDTSVGDVKYRLPGTLAAPGGVLTDPGGTGDLSWSTDFGAGSNKWYQQIPRGVKNGVNKDFFLDFVPVSDPTGTPPRVPFILEMNGIRQSAYFPDYYLAPGSNHLIMIVAPIDTDDWECHYFTGHPATSVSKPPPFPTPPPIANATFVQGAVGQVDLSSSLGIAFPSNNTAGGCLVVDILVEEPFGGSGTASVTDSQGNTYTAVGSHEQNNMIAAVYVAPNCLAGPNTVTVHYTGGLFGGQDIVAAIHEYSGVALTSPVDVIVYHSSAGGLPITVTTTTTLTGDILHAFCSVHGSHSWNNTAGWIQREAFVSGTANGSVTSFDVGAPTIASYVNTFNTSGSTGAQPAIYVLALKANTSAASTVGFSLPNGTVLPDTLQTLTLFTAVGSSIYYTTDGSTPTITSSVYSTPIPLPTAMTVKAIAVDPAGTVSSVVSASYTIGTPVVPGASGSANIFWKLSPSSDFFTNAPSGSDITFINNHVTQIMGYPGYWDSRIGSYATPSIFYRDSSALYHPADDALVAANPTWVYRDGGGNPCFINYGSNGGVYPQYAPNHADAGFRSWWISQALATFGAGWNGIWIDDVNMDINLVIEGGIFTRPIDTNTGQPVTDGNYQKYLVEFMEAIKVAVIAAHPSAVLMQNALWYNAGGNPSTNPYLTRQIQSLKFFNMERGFDDGGIQGGSGQFGLRTMFDLIDQIHGLGRNFVAEQTPGVGPTDYYPLACYFLVTNGTDEYQITEGDNPLAWAAFNFVNLGASSGARYDWNGLIRRDFANGTVLIAEPGGSGGGSLGATFTDPNGNSVSSVFLGSRQGTILHT